MIEVGNVLVRMHQEHPLLRDLGVGGNRVVFCLETDAEARTRHFPKATLTLSFEASETNAVVPFRATETVKVAEGHEQELARLEKAIRTALNGKARLLDPEARIHRVSCVGSAIEKDEPGTIQARIEWEGVASW